MIVMKQIISITLLIFLLIVNLNAVDNNSFNLTIKDNPSPGYIFMTPYLSQQFFLIDNTGEPVLMKKTENFDDFINPKLQPNGLLSFFSGTKYYVMNDNYELVDSFSCVGDYEVDFHDLILLPNGNTAMLGREKRVMDLSKIVTDGQKNANVIGSIIQELDKNKNVVFHWSSFDHFQITDVTPDVDLTQSGIISCHMNSIFYDTDGNIIASSRVLDEITKIDRNTGNIIWRLGGKECKNNQFRFLNDTIDGFYGFSHQHSVTRLSNGNLLLFDNGDIKPKPYSRAVEYKLDETNKTIEKVWEYMEFPEVSTFSMGNVQRLKNGNTMIGWGINTRNLTATEVKPDGTKMLEIVGYQNYSVYKFIYKMNAVTLLADKPGNYDFNLDTNKTNVKLAINNLSGEGDISVEKHYYQPHNLKFAGQEPVGIQGIRWVLSLDSGRSIDAVIKFFISAKCAIDFINYNVYYRPHEGTGDFIALETIYNNIEGCFEANIGGSGEFILGILSSMIAPIAVFPPDSAKGVEISTSFIWHPMSVSSEYRFQLSYYPDFSDLIKDSSNIIDTTLDLNLNYDTTYYWRVKAFNEVEQSPWSRTYMFVTEDASFVDNENKRNDKLFVFSNGGNLSFNLRNFRTGYYKLNLFDITGNIVSEWNVYCNSNNNLNFNIHNIDINPGIYLYRILSVDCIISGKILIQK